MSKDSTEQSDKLALLTTLFGLKQEDNANGVFTAQATLSNQNAADSMAVNAKQNQAVTNAFWSSKCGDAYVPPEPDEMGANLINCSIIGDDSIQQITKLLDNSKVPEPQPPTVCPPRPWWRTLLGILLAVALGAALILLAWRTFGDQIQQQYELIAEPFQAPEPIEYDQ